MITGSYGEKLTPKQKAQELVAQKLGELVECYWPEQEEGITQKEIEQVQVQMRKLASRIGYKYLGLVRDAFDD